MRKLLYLFLLFTSITLSQERLKLNPNYTIETYFGKPEGYHRNSLKKYNRKITSSQILISTANVARFDPEHNYLNELKTQDTYSVDINDIQPGDMFIKNGLSNNVALVVDVIKNKSGDKKFMLVLNKNIMLNTLKTHSAWYDLTESDPWIITSISVFHKTQLKRFISLKNEY